MGGWVCEKVPGHVPSRSPHARSLYEAEQRAKEARKKVWEGYQEGELNGQDEEEEKEEDVPVTAEEEESERSTNYQNVSHKGCVLIWVCCDRPSCAPPTGVRGGPH